MPICDSKHALQKFDPELDLEPVQITAFEELFKWRDSIARELDESVHFIMSNGSMEGIIYFMPDNKTDILRTWRNKFNPGLVDQVLAILEKAWEADNYVVSI